MLSRVPVPLTRLQVGRVLPVDIWTADGRLLLRRGQTLQSAAHREMLAAHQACMSTSDAQAWQRSLERSMRAMRCAGVDMATVAQAAMPEDILDIDYLDGREVSGGWLDVQDVLRSLLYQGAQASAPLVRLEGISHKALTLLRDDPEECLFSLFQALPDLTLGYCATHALLSGAVCALTAGKLALAPADQALLLRSALVMNIGMARPQDHLARQHQPPDAVQRRIIADHPPTSADILRGFGVRDDGLLAIVHWHHAPQDAPLPTDHLNSLRLLALSDTLVAKMAPRVSRQAITPLGAAQALMRQSTPDTALLRPALAAVLGFYPPGTYVRLANGETGVVVARGPKANSPHVASIINAAGLPLSKYIYRNTAAPGQAVLSPVASHGVQVKVSADKVRRLRQQHGL